MQGEGTSSAAVPAGQLVAPSPVRSLVKKKKWSDDEDEAMRRLVHTHGENWRAVHLELRTRSQRSCREHWSKLRLKATREEPSSAAADDHEPPRKKARLLELFPDLARGADDTGIPLPPPPPVEEEVAESRDADHQVLPLFDTLPGGIIRGAGATPAPSFEDGKDDPLTVLRLGPSPSLGADDPITVLRLGPPLSPVVHDTIPLQAVQMR